MIASGFDQNWPPTWPLVPGMNKMNEKEHFLETFKRRLDSREQPEKWQRQNFQNQNDDEKAVVGDLRTQNNDKCGDPD